MESGTQDRDQRGSGNWIPFKPLLTDLTQAYVKWALEEGEKYPKWGKKCKQRLEALGCKKSRRELEGKLARVWLGIRVKPEGEDDR